MTQPAATLSARVQPPATTTALQTVYRPLPTKIRPSTLTAGTNKRKRGSKSRPIRYFEDTPSESDETNDQSGDGDSSGDSISGAPPRAKRTHTSVVTTRSSVRPSALDSGIKDTPDPPPPAATIAQPSSAIPSTDTNAPVDRADTSSTDTSAITSTGSANLQSPNTLADAADKEDSLSGDILRANNEIRQTERFASATGPDPGSVTGSPSITAVVDPPLIPLGVIEVSKVPTFLRIHGKGKRLVDIFGYLDEIQDRHFRQVLYHYINFEVNETSGRSGSLPTINRPIEISQWTAKARPAALPDMKGGRSFSMYVDSVFAWWTSIQPPWRSFKRGTVSREVQGDWGVLYAPRINGLLNIVILVYWWAQALKDNGPEDSSYADYKSFADDVAWVFSHLST